MGKNIGTSTEVLGFVKEDGIWYADLPLFLDKGLGTKDDLMMVDGADTFLDILSDNSLTITLKLSPLPFIEHQIHMKKCKKDINKQLLDHFVHAPDDYGAYYLVIEMSGKPFDHQLWLCPVTEYVFGFYPDEIYASVV